LAGEEAIRQVGGRYLIFRTSWVYGPHGKNFLLTMLRLGSERERLSVVDDQHGAPTSSIALADVTRSVVNQVLDGRCGAPDAWAGVYHMTCAGSTTWCGFAKAIFTGAEHLLHSNAPVVLPIASSEYPTPARRPRNSVLSNARLKQRFGVELPAWEVALGDVLGRLTVESETIAPKSH
jgi:dTDP-4-dehydrorhamnose reductase